MNCDALTPRTAEHDLIAVGVFAHCQMGRFAVFGLWLAFAFTACCDDLSSADHDVGDLESEACPRLLTFATAVNRDEAASDFDLCDVWVLPRDGAAKAGEVERGRALGVGRPDGVFQFFNMHAVFCSQERR